jgi:pimeloyl-ACP methyl ester carboxylesterase
MTGSRRWSRTVPGAGATVSLRESGDPAGPAAVPRHGSRIVTIAAGHWVHSLRPEQFLAAVMPFLTV